MLAGNHISLKWAKLFLYTKENCCDFIALPEYSSPTQKSLKATWQCILMANKVYLRTIIIIEHETDFITFIMIHYSRRSIVCLAWFHTNTCGNKKDSTSNVNPNTYHQYPVENYIKYECNMINQGGTRFCCAVYVYIVFRYITPKILYFHTYHTIFLIISVAANCYFQNNNLENGNLQIKDISTTCSFP